MHQATHIISYITAFIVIFFSLVVFRLSVCLPQYRRRSKHKAKLLKALAFFGSGGHTTELLRAIRSMNPTRYPRWVFALSQTDTTSIDKIKACNLAFEGSAVWTRMHRAREVKQSWFSTIFSTMLSLRDAVMLVLEHDPDLIICNGPGTCVPICYAAFLLYLFGLRNSACQIIFIESFCRVEDLSLSGKLLYPIADKFLVQWPNLTKKYRHAEYIGAFC